MVRTRWMWAALAAWCGMGCDGYFGEFPERPEPGFAMEADMGQFKQPGDACGPCGRFRLGADLICEFSGLKRISEQDSCEAIGFVDTAAAEQGIGNESSPWKVLPQELPTKLRALIVAGNVPLSASLDINAPLELSGGWRTEAGRFMRSKERGSMVVKCVTADKICTALTLRASSRVEHMRIETEGQAHGYITVRVLKANGIEFDDVQIVAANGASFPAPSASPQGQGGEAGIAGEASQAGSGALSLCDGAPGGGGGGRRVIYRRQPATRAR